jgi:hypothetical protein
LDGIHPAEEIYTESAIFKKRKTFAHQHGGTWGILSAKYGFLHPWKRVEYYQKHISDRTNIWGVFVLKDLLPTLEYYNIDTVIILAGSKYVEPIQKPLEDEGYDVVDWNKGKMPGERMQALNEANAIGTQTTF